MMQRAKAEAKVQYATGNWSSATGTHGHCIRLSFCYYDQDTLCDGIRRLCRFIKAEMERAGAAAPAAKRART
jgi:DNA-binding transcriptional MocR family regulator